MSDKFRALAEAAFKGGAANVGPLIGVDLEIGEISIEDSGEVPSVPLAVLPLAAEAEGEGLGELTLASPLDEIATLARRMLDDANPDKIRAITSDEGDAIGEVLNLISGAVDSAARAALGEGVHTRPLRWWRSDEAGDNQLPEGEYALARGTLQISSAGTVSLWLRVPLRLLADGPTKQSSRVAGRVLLLGLEPELQSELEPIFARVQAKTDARAPDDPELAEALEAVNTVVLSGERSESLALCRRLRSDRKTWKIPVVVCLRNPTRTSVLEAVDAGAVHVLAIPVDEINLLRTLQQSSPGGSGAGQSGGK